MLLSIQQKYILEVLRKLRVLRREQLAALVRGKFQRPGFEITDARMEAMLRQLRSGMGDVCLDGQFVLLSGASPNSLLLEALDVMLELAEGKPEDFTVRVDRPGILRFSWGNNLRLFTVELSAPIRPIVELLAQEKRVVWISGGGIPCQTGSVPEGLILPPKHFFAARLEDGSHRFYGSNVP